MEHARTNVISSKDFFIYTICSSNTSTLEYYTLKFVKHLQSTTKLSLYY